MTDAPPLPYETVVDAFLNRQEYTIGQDTSYPFGGVSHGMQHFALACVDLKTHPQAPLVRYAWHQGQSVMMMGFRDATINRIIFDRLNYLSGKLGMEHDAFRLRRNKLFVGLSNPMRLEPNKPIEWRPGMTSIDQLLAYQMMVQN